MANTQLIVLFVLHSKATIWWCYFFRKHEETECKWWMISNDIRLHGGRWYWHEFKKPQTVLNWEGKISGKGWARFSSSWECHCYTSAVSYNRKVTFSVIGGPLSEIGLCLFYSVVGILMKARPSLSFQAIIDVAQGKFIILKMRANIKRGRDFRRLKSVKSSFHFFRRLSAKSKIWEQRMPWP